MHKFLIIRFSSIGDIIQCMGVVGGIRAKFPDAEIHWITRKDMVSILTIDKRVNKVWGLDKTSGLRGLLEIATLLRSENYDYVYDAHSNIRSKILKLILWPRFTRRPNIALRRKERRKNFLLFKLGINRFEWPFKGAESYKKPLKKWGITSFPNRREDWKFPEEISSRHQKSITNNTITLVPSANWEMKRWPVAHWQQLITLLPDYHFIILGGPTDGFCEEIRQAAPGRTINLAGKTTLMESCYLVSQSNVVVSADTGFMHAADLFQIPALALMGPTAFGFPSNPGTEVLEVNLGCRPCTKDGHGKCKQAIYQRCMVEITPDKVARRIAHLLPLSTT